MPTIKDNDDVLLLSAQRYYFYNISRGSINVDEGIIDLKALVGKKYGSKITTHKGKEFSVIKPNIVDYFNKKLSRMPAVILPKDTGMILAITGIGHDAKVVEAGTGSACATMFIASYCNKGKVFTYEIREDFYKNAEKNINASGLKNIKMKNQSILDGIKEKDVDLVLLDMRESEKAVPIAYKALAPGGFIVIYSPYIEQVKASVEAIFKLGFTDIKTFENITRYWDVRDHTLPERQGMMHTGFITIARKY